MSGQFAVALTGANPAGGREPDEFYTTPPDCTLGLLQTEGVHLRGKRILEPCCGDGAISRVLVANGFEVVSTDLIDRGYGLTGFDFLKAKSTDCDAVVTNPPFSLSEDMIVHALDRLKCSYVAMLLKQNYWSANREYASSTSTRHRCHTHSHGDPISCAVDDRRWTVSGSFGIAPDQGRNVWSK